MRGPGFDAGSGPVLGGEVLVLHLPGMVEGVVGGVADEEWERRGPHAPLDLPGVVGVHRGDVGLAMLAQAIRGERRALGDPYPDLLGEVLALGADGVADDLVAVASSPAGPLAHLRGDPRRHAVKDRPAGPQERDPALELLLAHRLLLGRRGRDGDAPEVGRTGSDLVLHDLQGPGGVELAYHPGETRDRTVAFPVGLERLQGELGALGAPTPPWPVDAEGHRPLPLGASFEDGADRHGSLLHGATMPPAADSLPAISDFDVDRPDDLPQFLVSGVPAWLGWRGTPGKVGSVDLHQPPGPVGLADGEQGADVVLGHDLHERVLHHLEAVEDVGWDNGDIARTAGPALVADPHDDLAADDPEHLVPEVGVHRPAAGVGG